MALQRIIPWYVRVDSASNIVTGLFRDEQKAHGMTSVLVFSRRNCSVDHADDFGGLPALARLRNRKQQSSFTLTSFHFVSCTLASLESMRGQPMLTNHCSVALHSDTI